MTQVRSGTGHGVYASNGLLYKDAIFGRDSIVAAMDLLRYDKRIAEEVIRTLASLQGKKNDPRSEEEPGKILHEYRTMVVEGRKVSPEVEKVIRKIIEMWGHEGDDEIIYYGSIDSTPLFIKLVFEYYALYGKSILDTSAIRESLLSALHWLESKLTTSPLGLLEYKGLNPAGLYNQSWKDSYTSYIHLNGDIVNFVFPIASIEVQGYAYDALVKSVILKDFFPEDVSHWLKLADHIQKTVMEKFWMEDKSYFAQAIDRDISGKERQVQTYASNTACLLNSSIFDTLPEDKKTVYISGIVKTIYSENFLTNVGIRCRAKEHAELISYQDYHGSWSVWPKDTFEIAKGLLRQGFPLLAEQLFSRIMNAVNITSGYPEFLYVNPVNGHTYYGKQSLKTDTPDITVLNGEMVPEAIQTWALSAVLAIVKDAIYLDKVLPQHDWQKKLEKELLEKLPSVSLITSEEEITKAYPPHPYVIEVREPPKSQW